MGDKNIVGIIKNDNSSIEVYSKELGDLLLLTNAVSFFIKDAFCDLETGQADFRLMCNIGFNKGYYTFKDNTLLYIYKTVFGKQKETVQVEDITSIIWCSQRNYISSSEDGETYWPELYIYCLNDKKKTKRIDVKSDYDGFRLFEEIKKRVPHVLYGYQPEYERIYKENPQKLLSIALRITNE